MLKLLIVSSLLIGSGALASEAVTDESFPNDVTSSKGVVFVVFTRKGCMSCDAFSGEVPAIEKGVGGRLLLMDVNREHRTHDALDITTLPTTVVFRDGKEVGRLVGGGNHKDVIPMLSRIATK